MRPETEAELAEIIKGAAAPLSIRGGNTRGMAPEGDVLETGGLSGVELYEPGALTLVVKAGTPVAEVEALLATEGQRLPFEPMDHRALLGTTGVPTMGGVVAANISGPRRVQAGACRDYLLGVRFVDGNGVALKNGGRVMKNVTGYDLVKLMAGSYGTLGVLTEVSFKVLPQPEAAACVLIEGLSDDVAVQAMSAALGSPFDVTGAAHAPVGVDGAPVTMIRVEGFEGSVAYRAEQLKSLLGGFGDLSVETAPERLAAGWKWIRDVEAFAGQEGDVWRISVKPSDGPKVAAALDAKAVVYDWGGGLVWVLMPAGRDIRSALSDMGGHASLVRASSETKARVAMLQPEPAPVAALSKGIRQKYDPRGILNAGLMG
ncbi:putative FAD-linked oxidoreductase [Thalassovita autumnalis]|uniref:FAD-linked oxidoreductase n=1 Tax=Thalassovita autumnalis TaxID=2072972 RepID=A0A0N7LX61_9RHOB|nr:FAD-binding protein [Thalassovita autumnalis]CUH69785.1 putative FAD-linked oxidoreductase [Thalassovita autumnalis]CUH71007.1 putative FAD-linked oxidoreductase [Thalassovita autumnalis]